MKKDYDAREIAQGLLKNTIGVVDKFRELYCQLLPQLAAIEVSVASCSDGSRQHVDLHEEINYILLVYDSQDKHMWFKELDDVFSIRTRQGAA